MLCVGLDPDPARFPDSIERSPVGALDFCRRIVDATAPFVCAFKPQIAYFAAMRAETELEKLCEHIRDEHPDVVLVLDAKRGDIGPTADRYASEAFDRYGADAVTVNPYLGLDAVEPFVTTAAERQAGIFVLVKTSNPGSKDFQDLRADGATIYEHVAAGVERLAARTAAGGRYGEIGRAHV